jgi:hypothetical protein
LLSCAALLAQLGCNGKNVAPSQAPHSQANGVEYSGEWRVGPSVDSRKELETWIRNLQQEPSTRRHRVRLPVVVAFDKDRLEIESASIGISTIVFTDIELVLDDSALGIPLIDRLRRRCSPSQSACVVWLEGRWGLLVTSEHGAGRATAPYPLAVLRVLEQSPTDAANVLQFIKR